LANAKFLIIIAGSNRSDATLFLFFLGVFLFRFSCVLAAAAEQRRWLLGGDRVMGFVFFFSVAVGGRRQRKRKSV
jgi:hypothetical protein